LWHYYSVKENGNYFFLDLVNSGKRKVAYATSFGHSSSFFPKERQLDISKCLQQFTAISVREKDGIDICRDTFGVHAVQNMDPVFLCDLSAYEKAIKDSAVNENEPYLLAYILNPSKEKRESLLKAAQKMNLPLKVILDGQENYKENRELMNLGESVLDVIGIEDWLYYFKNANFIITDSYHGLCFSIIFHKNFICIGNKKRGMSRFETLLDITKLHNRLVMNPAYEKMEYLFDQHIDYDEIDKLLLPEKERSLKWLTDALNKPLVKNQTFSNLVLEEISNLERRINKLEGNDHTSNNTVKNKLSLIYAKTKILGKKVIKKVLAKVK